MSSSMHSWQADLARGAKTNLDDLLDAAPDDAALGVGILAWTARARSASLLKPGAIVAMLVRLTDGKPTEMDLPALDFDGKRFGPWTIMLCPAGQMTELLPWDSAVSDKHHSEFGGNWLQGWEASKPGGEVHPAAILADHADLLHFNLASFGASLRPAMKVVARRQGCLSALLLAVNMTEMLHTGLSQNGTSIHINAKEVTVGSQRMGDWSLSCSPLASTRLTRDDDVMEASTSTLDGARQVRDMLNGDCRITGLTISYEGDEPVQVSVRGPR